MYKYLVQFFKYGMVGACGTLTHYVWLIALSTIFSQTNPAYFAFSGAFLGATVNYCLNYHYTFLSVKKHVLAFPQFAVLAVLNMLASGLIVQIAINMGVHYFIGQLLATALCWPVGFIISKKVVFNAKRY